jgi:hypothetical protein
VKLFGVPLIRLVLIMLVAIVIWHFIQAKRGAVSGSPAKPKAGPGTASQVTGTG